MKFNSFFFRKWATLILMVMGGRMIVMIWNGIHNVVQSTAAKQGEENRQLETEMKTMSAMTFHGYIFLLHCFLVFFYCCCRCSCHHHRCRSRRRRLRSFFIFFYLIFFAFISCLLPLAISYGNSSNIWITNLKEYWKIF